MKIVTQWQHKQDIIVGRGSWYGHVMCHSGSWVIRGQVIVILGRGSWPRHILTLSDQVVHMQCTVVRCQWWMLLCW